MQAFVYPDPYIRRLLRENHTFAVIGASANEDRDSFKVIRYMQQAGYRMIPVNPGHAGSTILGERVYASLSDIPEKFDVVDIFRSSDAVPALVDESISLAPEKGISTIWLQLGVYAYGLAAKLKPTRIDLVINRCPKFEHQRLIAS